MPGTASVLEKCQLLAPLHLTPPPQHTHSIPDFPERQDFRRGLNRHQSRCFFTEKMKGKKVIRRGLGPGSPHRPCQSCPCCASCDMPCSCYGLRAWPGPTSTLVWEVRSTDCVFRVPQICMTCEEVTHLVVMLGKHRKGRNEGSVSEEALVFPPSLSRIPATSCSRSVHMPRALKDHNIFKNNKHRRSSATKMERIILNV